MNMHHRFYVLTRHKMGISGKQFFAELSLTNKDTCPSLHTIWRWIAEIKKGCFELSKGKSPGKPVSTSAGPNIQKVKGLIEENCRLTCTELEAITGIPKSTVHEIRNRPVIRLNPVPAGYPASISSSGSGPVSNNFAGFLQDFSSLKCI